MTDREPDSSEAPTEVPNASGSPLATQQPIRITSDMLRAPARRSAERPLDVTDDGRVDFEEGMSYAPPATLVLLLSLVAVFAWQVQHGALESREAIVAAGALERERVLAGEWWRLFSAAFLHGGVGHIAGNAVSLYILGMALEHAVGAPRFLLVYVLSALGGSLLSVATSPGPSVGASGAIFGLLGATALVLHRWRDRYRVRDTRIRGVLVVWAIYALVTGAVVPMIDNWAHLGGLVAGVTVAAFLTREDRRKR